MIIYRTFWKEKGNPDNSGEGQPVVSPKQAQHICDEHNRMFPAMKHWYEREEQDESLN